MFSNSASLKDGQTQITVIRNTAKSEQQTMSTHLSGLIRRKLTLLNMLCPFEELLPARLLSAALFDPKEPGMLS